METHPKATAKFEDAFAKLQQRMWDPSEKLFVDVRKIEPSRPEKRPRRGAPTQDAPATMKLFEELRPHVQPLRKCVPGFALVWGDQIAARVLREEHCMFDVSTSAATGTHEYHQLSEQIVINLIDPLWHGVSTTEDADKGWLDDVSVATFDDAGNELPGISLPREAVELKGPAMYADGGYYAFEVTLSRAPDVLQAIYASGGRFKLSWGVRCATGWLWGVSYGLGNVVVVATRSRWQPLDPKDVAATMIHEVAHKLGMVPDGVFPAHLLQSSTEDGSRHCTDHGCVLLAVGTAPETFCKTCAKAMRRSDLSLGSGIYGANVAI
jgi:hypothetical protein